MRVVSYVTRVGIQIYETQSDNEGERKESISEQCVTLGMGGERERICKNGE